MGDTKTSDNNNATDMPKDEEKVKHNNNIFGRGGSGGITRGKGYHRGTEHLAENRGRFHVFNRGRGQDYRDRGRAANFRGRYGYANNGRRGRGYGWHNSGRGAGWYAGRDSQFYKPRMINTGPWSAYRDRQQPRVNSQYSTHPIPTKIFMNPSTDFNPQIPPPAYYNSHLEPSSYYQPQTGASTACSYYHPQADASVVPDSASGLVVVNNGGQMYNYQGASFVEVEGNTLPVVSQDSSILQVVAQMPRLEVLETAMSGLGLASSGGMQSASSGGSQSSTNINGEKCSNNNQGEETPSEKDGAGEVLSSNPEISKTSAYMRSSAGEENTKLTQLKNKSGQEASGVTGGEASGVTWAESNSATGCAFHLATVTNPLSALGQSVDQDKQLVEAFAVTNPLSALGQSVDQDKQLVEAFAGVEMRPVSPFPPNTRLQYFFVPYGSPPPQHVIPVMVFPVLPVGHSPEVNQVTQVREAGVEDGQVKQNGESAHGNEFPPPRSLLPSYMGSMDLPCSPTPVEFHQPEPSPVEIYQPFNNPWPHQFMMDPLAPNVQLDHQSYNGDGQ